MRLESEALHIYTYKNVCQLKVSNYVTTYILKLK